MATRKKSKPKPKRSRQKSLDESIVLTFKRPHINVFIDKILLFRFIRQLHGRFWGIAAIGIMSAGFGVCFLIRPDMFVVSTAISDFGNDVRTAPYFAGSMFFGAYGLWRWRNYLARTWQRARPVTGLVSLTIIGLYLVALMPVSWRPWPYWIHYFGMTLAGVTISLTVILDTVLTKPRKGRSETWSQFLRLLCFGLIISGGWLTLGSSEAVNLYQVSLLGEGMMIGGYALWIAIKTYIGEGSRSFVSKQLRKIVLVD